MLEYLSLSFVSKSHRTTMTDKSIENIVDSENFVMQYKGQGLKYLRGRLD